MVEIRHRWCFQVVLILFAANNGRNRDRIAVQFKLANAKRCSSDAEISACIQSRVDVVERSTETDRTDCSSSIRSISDILELFQMAQHIIDVDRWHQCGLLSSGGGTNCGSHGSSIECVMLRLKAVDH